MISSKCNRLAAMAIMALVAGAATAHADLNINGAVGLPLNPTAQLPALAQAQWDYNDMGDNSGGNWKLYSGHVAGRVGQRLELNGGIEHSKATNALSGLDERAELAFGAKLMLRTATDPNSFNVAVGVGTSHAFARDSYGYLVGSSGVGPLYAGGYPSTVHLGVRYDRFDLNSIAVGTSNKASFFAGAEVPVFADGKVAAVGELQTKNTNFAGAKFPFSLGLRYQPTGKGFYGTVGLQRQGITGSSGLAVHIGYNFVKSAPALVNNP